MHFFFKILKSKYGECTHIEQEWTLINGHINNWTRTLDNDLMCDTRPIVKDTFAHTNTSMILGSCELLSFFFYLFCYSPDTKTIYILWDLLFISWLCADLKYYKNWNHSKMANTNVPRTPSLPHPGDFFRSDPRTMQPILFYSISIPVFNKLKNNHILTALW